MPDKGMSVVQKSLEWNPEGSKTVPRFRRTQKDSRQTGESGPGDQRSLQTCPLPHPRADRPSGRHSGEGWQKFAVPLGGCDSGPLHATLEKPENPDCTDWWE